MIFMKKDAAVHREVSKVSYIFTDKMNDTYFLLNWDLEQSFNSLTLTVAFW